MTRGGILASGAAVGCPLIGAFALTADVPGADDETSSTTRAQGRCVGEAMEALSRLARARHGEIQYARPNWRPRRAEAPRKLTGSITGDSGMAPSWWPIATAAAHAAPAMSWARPVMPTCQATPGPNVRDRQCLSEDEWLFNYVYDGRVYNPDTVMPPWGRHGFLTTRKSTTSSRF